MIQWIKHWERHLIGGCFTFSIIANLLGCAAPADSPLSRQARIEGLSNEIQRVCGPVKKAAARKVAETAVNCSARKREEWGVGCNPWVHNALVNAQFRKYGLCYHWSNALWDDLRPVLPHQLKMTLIETDSAGFSLGHHAVSLHRADGYWTQGVVLDGWKGGGMLVYQELSKSGRKWRFENSAPYWRPE